MTYLIYMVSQRIWLKLEGEICRCCCLGSLRRQSGATKVRHVKICCSNSGWLLYITLFYTLKHEPGGAFMQFVVASSLR